MSEWTAEAARAAIEQAEAKLDALCQGTERFTMRIPADPEYDHDLVISRGLQAGIEALNALAAAEQRAASMAARIAGFDPCAIDLEDTAFIVCFFCGANLDCDAETPLEQQAHRSLCLWLEAKAASPTTGGEGVGDGH